VPATLKERGNLGGIEALLLCPNGEARGISSLLFEEECDIRFINLSERINDPFGLLWLCVGLLQV
jgi:hypothetical protein